MATQVLHEQSADATAQRELPAPRPAPAAPKQPEAFLPRQDDATSAPEEPPHPAASPPAAPDLTERDRAVLLFEKQYWKYSGAKEQAIRDRFGMSASSYYQILNSLLDRPEAQEFEPVTVKRLRRERELRRRARSARTAAAARR